MHNSLWILILQCSGGFWCNIFLYFVWRQSSLGFREVESQREISLLEDLQQTWSQKAFQTCTGAILFCCPELWGILKSAGRVSRCLWWLQSWDGSHPSEHSLWCWGEDAWAGCTLGPWRAVWAPVSPGTARQHCSHPAGGATKKGAAAAERPLLSTRTRQGLTLLNSLRYAQIIVSGKC